MLASHTQYAVLYYGLMSMVLATSLTLSTGRKNFSRKGAGAFLLLIFMICIIGLRDWESPDFGDSYTYGINYIRIFNPDNATFRHSKLYGFIVYYFHTINLSVEAYFVVCAIIYCVPSYLLSRRLSQPYSSFVFLLFITTSFGWYAFGVNGIRNGWAMSLMTLALLAYYDKKTIIALLCLFLAWCIHGSSIIAIGGYFAAYFYNKPQKVFYIWIACVLISFVFGNFASELFASIDFVDKDGGSYLKTEASENADQFSHTGFRFDFILYSLAPILWGRWCVKRLAAKNNEDFFYNFLLCSYMFANAVWVLVVRASYSNRIAQLSWWMIPFILAYPIYRMDIFTNRCKIAVVLLLCTFGFNYFMYIK